MVIEFYIVDSFEVDGKRKWRIEDYDGPIPQQGDTIIFGGEPAYEVDHREIALSERRQECDWVTLHLRPV